MENINHEKRLDLARLFRLVLASLLVVGGGVQKAVAQDQNREELPCDCDKFFTAKSLTLQELDCMRANCFNDLPPEIGDEFRELIAKDIEEAYREAQIKAIQDGMRGAKAKQDAREKAGKNPKD